MARIAGLGKRLPEALLDNETLAAELGVTPGWILGACGIRERRVAAPGEGPAELALGASEAALADGGFLASDLGAIVVGTGTSGRRFPGVSADLQRLLAVPGIPAFDVPLASSGGLYALALAADLSQRYGPVLAVGVDVMTRALGAPRAKETAILFGDGAGAAVVVPGSGGIEVVDVRLGSDGSFADALELEAGAALTMDGRAVILQASRKLPAAIRDVLARNGLAPADADLFVLHQANLNLLRAVARSLGVGEERLFVNIERYGNTSSASLLIALAEAGSAGLLSAGKRVVLAAFGAGFSWGAALLSVRG